MNEHLKESLQEAQSRLSAVHNERSKMEREHKEAAAQRIERMLAEIFDEKIKDLGALVAAARKMLDEALEAQAVAGIGAPRPLGTKFFHWDLQHYPRNWFKTGKIGVVEAVTRETVHPDGKAAYRVANVGDFILRLLKKDGTPSKNYERFTSNFKESLTPPWGWHVEGEDPNVKDREAIARNRK